MRVVASVVYVFIIVDMSAVDSSSCLLIAVHSAVSVAILIVYLFHDLLNLPMFQLTLWIVITTHNLALSKLQPTARCDHWS